MSRSNTRLCRITGLTSAKGSKFNGSAARALLEAQGDRLPVCIDGQPDGPVALKRDNLVFLPNHAFDCGIGVGRGTLRDSQFNATVVDNRAGRILTQLRVSGGAARSRGNLMAIEAFLKMRKSQRAKGMLLIMPSDLNVARAVNRIAAGERDVTMDAPLDRTLKSVAKLLHRETETGNMVFVHFSPHRVSPDGFAVNERLGAARFGASLMGAFKIYPCPYAAYHDAMEVRYVDSTSAQKTVVKHEIYLDYGLEEAESYVRHAAALEETERLSPTVLAQVDPQAFWAAVLHIEPFVETLKKCKLQELVTEWNDVVEGVEKSTEFWKEASKGSVVSLSASVAAGTGNDWGIQSEVDHKKVSNNCAMVAILMMMKCAGKSVEEGRNEKTDDEDRDLKRVVIQTLDYYKGTELDRLVTAFSWASDLEDAHISRGKKLKAKHRDQYMNQALEEAGFGSDALDLNSDPLSHCGHCGSVDKAKLMNCGGCNGAAYCGRECQMAARKAHKKECDPIIAQGRRLMRDCARRSGIEFKVSAYKPRSTLPTENAVLTETTAFGSVGILWFPGKKSFLTFTDFQKRTPNGGMQDIAAMAVADRVEFENLSELSPPIRFLLTCGPLPDITIAQSSLNDALRLVHGDITKLRVNIAGFNALEWAAKKGNSETVEWLCTDDRTKALVNVGCPVGWACYTGQVVVARSLVTHGADPAATDDTLWYRTPPLLVAAQNGQLGAMKYLVEELGQDIHMRDPTGRDVLQSIKTVPDYKSLPGHKASYDWAKEKMG